MRIVTGLEVVKYHLDDDMFKEYIQDAIDYIELLEEQVEMQDDIINSLDTRDKDDE